MKELTFVMISTADNNEENPCQVQARRQKEVQGVRTQTPQPPSEQPWYSCEAYEIGVGCAGFLADMANPVAYTLTFTTLWWHSLPRFAAAVDILVKSYNCR
jgi:hypothetical protein